MSEPREPSDEAKAAWATARVIALEEAARIAETESTWNHLPIANDGQAIAFAIRALKVSNAMKPPVLTMHTNDTRDRLWITCDCGWRQDASDFASPEEARDLSQRLVDDAKAHWVAAHISAGFVT